MLTPPFPLCMKSKSFVIPSNHIFLARSGCGADNGTEYTAPGQVPAHTHLPGGSQYYCDNWLQREHISWEGELLMFKCEIY